MAVPPHVAPEVQRMHASPLRPSAGGQRKYASASTARQGALEDWRYVPSGTRTAGSAQAYIELPPSLASGAAYVTDERTQAARGIQVGASPSQPHCIRSRACGPWTANSGLLLLGLRAPTPFHNYYRGMGSCRRWLTCSGAPGWACPRVRLVSLQAAMMGRRTVQCLEHLGPHRSCRRRSSVVMPTAQ